MQPRFDEFLIGAIQSCHVKEDAISLDQSEILESHDHVIDYIIVERDSVLYLCDCHVGYLISYYYKCISSHTIE